MSIIEDLRDALYALRDLSELNFLRQSLSIHIRSLASSIDELDLRKGNAPSVKKFDEAIELCLGIVLDFPSKIPHASPKTRELVEYVSSNCSEKLQAYRNFKKNTLPRGFGLWHVFGAIVILGVIVGVVSKE